MQWKNAGRMARTGRGHLPAGAGLCLLLLPLTAAGQSAAPPPLRAPLVHADGSVTFYYASRTAAAVAVTVDTLPGPLNLTPSNDGQWSATTPPLRPEIYSYHDTVDGVAMADPASPWTTPNLLYHSSMVLVPGSAAALPPQPWEQANIPHGVVERHFYHSAVAGDDRDYFVYTPPGYDARARQKYPVLYLLHGFSDEANAWTAVGRANFILDSLIASGKAVPMLVVMPLGYGAPEILAASPPGRALRERNVTNFIQALLTEVMPQVEAHYRVATGPAHTAIAGLSMGGAESLVAGVEHPEKFAYVAALSPALHLEEAQTLRWQARRKLLWISCGEQDALVGDDARALYGLLKENKTPATLNWTSGSHTWAVWRENLISLAPLLFR